MVLQALASLIKDPSSLRNVPLNFWEAQRVVLTHCVVETAGDTNPSGVLLPSPSSFTGVRTALQSEALPPSPVPSPLYPSQVNLLPFNEVSEKVSAKLTGSSRAKNAH